jgi:LmbE family N-acetylglucosaminyl deacetylase
MASPALHLFLSPHLDDAALSCGGQIRQLADAGQQVRVLNLFAGRPGPELSPFARRVHAAWGDPPDVVGLRLTEDDAAMRVLGAEPRYWAEREALYRQGPDGAWLYPSREELFGAVHPAERPEALAAALAGEIPAGEAVAVYAPLGVGDHVDHQLTHGAARALEARGVQVLYYEDYPYTQRPGLLAAARAARGALVWIPRLLPLRAEDLAAKIEAIRAYRSQLGHLFGGEKFLADLVRAYALAAGGGSPAERLWAPT